MKTCRCWKDGAWMEKHAAGDGYGCRNPEPAFDMGKCVADSKYPVLLYRPKDPAKEKEKWMCVEKVEAKYKNIHDWCNAVIKV